MARISMGQKEINWLLQEKYQGEKTAEAEKDIARLEKGEHVDYVIGWVNFLDCRIDLSQKPLIPRSETEYWTGKAIEEMQMAGEKQTVASRTIKFFSRFTLKGSDASRKISSFSRRLSPTISQTPSPPLSRHLESTISQNLFPASSALRVLDIFAGSGCVGVAALKHMPSAHVDFAEKERKFLKQIEINTKLNSIEKSRYKVLQSDVFSGVSGKYNFILANPPYVPETKKQNVQQSVLLQEPYKAVFGGQDGLLYIRKLLKEAKNYLAPGGVVYLEFDSFQKKEIAQLLKNLEYASFEFYKDQYNKWRFVRIVFK